MRVDVHACAYACAPAHPFQFLNQVIHFQKILPKCYTVGVYASLLFSLHPICNNKLADAQEQKWDMCSNKSSANVQLYFYI